MSVVHSIAAAALAVALAACTPGAPGPPRPASGASPCPGNVVLDVRNDYREAVEIYAYVGSTKTFVGYASPGTASITMPPTNGGYIGYAFAELNGRRVSTAPGNARGVTIQRRCATAD
jgi:hypothetical protein